MELLNELLKEYQRLLEKRQDYEEWLNEFPDLHSWDYPEVIISKARITRTGLILRQTMIDYEKK